MTVYKHAIPDDQRVDNHPVCQDIFLQLFPRFFPQGRNFACKLRANGEMLQHRAGAIPVSRSRLDVVVETIAGVAVSTDILGLLMCNLNIYAFSVRGSSG